MKYAAFFVTVALFSCLAQEGAASTSVFFPDVLLFEREGADAENPTGSYGPSSVSPDPIAGSIPGVTLEDPATYPTTVLDVSADISSNTYDGGTNMDAGLPNLTGTNFQLVYSFQFYDADGIFSFSHRRDDVTLVDVVAIGGPTDPSEIGTVVSKTLPAGGDNPVVGEFVAGGCTSVAIVPGCAGSLGDYGLGLVQDECQCACSTWLRVDYDLSGANYGNGWYSVTISLDEDGDNTDKLSEFGFSNGGVTNATIGVDVDVFDTDPDSGFSYGSILTGPVWLSQSPSRVEPCWFLLVCSAWLDAAAAEHGNPGSELDTAAPAGAL